MGADTLIFAQDPGAATYLADLPVALAAEGFVVRVLAAGAAEPVFAAAGVAFEAVRPEADAGSLLERFAPRSVVVGTAEDAATPGLRLIDAAGARRIPALGVVDGPASAEWRFRGIGADPLAHAPDWLAVPDAPCHDLYAGLGFRADRIAVCGHPAIERAYRGGAALGAHDRAAHRAAVYPEAPADRPVVLFVGERSDGAGPDARFRRSGDYTLEGTGRSQRRTDIAIEVLLTAVDVVSGPSGVRPFLVLRPHPKDDPADYASYRAGFDAIGRSGDPWRAAWAADLVVGLTSIFLYEAAVLGRPTLSIVSRPDEASWLSSIGLGLTACAWTREGVVDWLGGFAADGWCRAAPEPDPAAILGATKRLVDLVGRLVGAPAMSRAI